MISVLHLVKAAATDKLEHSGNYLKVATVQCASAHVLMLVQCTIVIIIEKLSHTCMHLTNAHDETDVHAV